MLKLAVVNQTTFFLELFHNILIGIFHVLSYEVGYGSNKLSRVIKGTNDFPATFDNHASCQADTIIVLTKIRSLKKYVNIFKKFNHYFNQTANFLWFCNLT